jgi:hypothetical protein
MARHTTTNGPENIATPPPLSGSGGPRLPSQTAGGGDSNPVEGGYPSNGFPVCRASVRIWALEITPDHAWAEPGDTRFRALCRVPGTAFAQLDGGEGGIQTLEPGQTGPAVFEFAERLEKPQVRRLVQIRRRSSEAICAQRAPFCVILFTPDYACGAVALDYA